MNCVLANRRKWFQPTPEPDVPSTWANFNLAKAKYVGSAQLSSDNSLGNTPKLQCYGISALLDGRILINDFGTDYIYVWGFEDGHSFEVAKFKSTYDSRVKTNYFGGTQFGPDGKTLYIGRYNTTKLCWCEFLSAYDLNTNIETDMSTMWETKDGISAYTGHMQFSADGKTLFYKPRYSEQADSSSALFWRKSDLAWPTPTALSGTAWAFELKRMQVGDLFNAKIIETTSTVTSLRWGGFCFSPDGLAVIFTIGGNTTDTATMKSKYAVKFVMTEAWNPSTMVYHSKRYLGDDIGLTGIPQVCCVNADGTKMIIFESAEKKFHEYTLV